MTLTDSEILRYIEETHGRLSYSDTRTTWPDGSTADGVWQYSAGLVGVLSAKTVREAVQTHKDSCESISRSTNN